MTTASPDDISSAAIQLLRTPCTCFDRFEATAQPFNPGAAMAAEALRRFRHAMLRNIHPLPPTSNRVSAGAMLFVSRQGERRTLTNEAEVLSLLGRRLDRVQRVAFEELSLTTQMRVVSDASVLIAVHGQALAWLPFLPWESQPTGVVEVSLVGRRGVVNKCYEVWSKALGVHYWRVVARLMKGCNGGVRSRDNEAERAHKMLSCNVSVELGALLGAATRAAELTAVASKAHSETHGTRFSAPRQ